MPEKTFKVGDIVNGFKVTAADSGRATEVTLVGNAHETPLYDIWDPVAKATKPGLYTDVKVFGAKLARPVRKKDEGQLIGFTLSDHNPYSRN